MLDETMKKYELRASIEKAEAGDLQGMYDFLSYMYQTGMEIEPDDDDIRERMLRCAQRLMDADEPAGYYYMATFYENGSIVPKDTAKAIELYIKAGDLGAEWGYDYAGLLYYGGDGMEPDYEKAFDLLGTEGRNKQPEAVYVLGDMYRLGLGVGKNADKAVTHYILAAAAFEKMLHEAEDYTDDQMQLWRKLLARARYWIARAFDAGNTELGKNPEQAQRLLTEAWSLAAKEEKGSEIYGVSKEMIQQKLAGVQSSR